MRLPRRETRGVAVTEMRTSRGADQNGVDRTPARARVAAAVKAARPETVAAPAAAERALAIERLGLACLGGFAALLPLVRANRTAAVDLAVTLRLQRWKRPWFGRVMQAVSWPGFPPQSRVIPPLLVGGWLLAGLRVEALCQAGAWGTALTSTVIKEFAKRPRPVAPQVAVVLAPLGGSSFPSGHVLTYVGVYGGLAYLLATRLRNEPARSLAIAPPLALVALVGPSRVQQGHHWTTDVLASYLLGTAWLAGIAEIHRRLLRRVPTERRS